MACNFSIDLSQSADKIVSKAESAITRAGGKFSGDESSGTFSISAGVISIAGTYTIDDNKMNVQIGNKPVFLSCSRIESELKKYLTEGYA